MNILYVRSLCCFVCLFCMLMAPGVVFGAPAEEASESAAARPNEAEDAAAEETAPSSSAKASSHSGSATIKSRELVVSATRTVRELFEVPSTVSVVTEQQMAREPKTTIAEALQDVPGIQVQDSGMGGGAKRVLIRGENPKRVLILIDGMKLSEQKSMEGSMILMDANNIERIEVIKGPASVLYGSEAIGGVVNLITKKGGARPVQGSLVTTYDSSNDSFTPFASLYGKIGGFSYRIAGDYTDASDKHGASGTIDNSDYMQRNGSFYVDYAWNKVKIGGGYDYYKANINIPAVNMGPMVMSLDLPKWKRDRWYGFLELNELSNVLQKIKLTGFTSRTVKDFSTNISGGGRTETRPGMGFNMESEIDIATLNKQRSYGATLQTDWTFGEDHYVIFGLDYLRDTLKAHQGMYSYTRIFNSNVPKAPNGVTFDSGNGKYYYKGNQDTYAAFLQDEWSFADDWTATLGVRGTWIRSKLTDTNAALDTGSDSDSNVSFSAGLVYTGFEDWSLRAQYGQGYRYPLLNEMYIGTPHGGQGVLYPNADLKPEKSQSVEVGARYSGNNIEADVAVYYTWSRDYIYQEAINAKDSRFENADKAKTGGVEASFAYTIQELHLTPYIQGAFMHREYEANAYTTSRTGDPRWTGRAGVRFAKDVAEEVELHADLYARAASRAKQYSSSTSNEYPGWGTANFAIGARFGEERNFFVDLNLNNLLDKDYKYASSNLEEPGFNAVIRAGVEF